MSTSWNHLKQITNKMNNIPADRKYFPKNPAGTSKDLAKFTQFMADERKRP